MNKGPVKASPLTGTTAATTASAVASQQLQASQQHQASYHLAHGSIQVSTFKYLWNSYLQSVVYQDSLFALVDFLKYFVQNHYETPSNLLFLSLGSLTDVTRHLSKRLIEEIGCALNSVKQTGSVPPALAVYQYLIGYSIAGEGPLLLTSLEILSRARSNGIPMSLVRLLVTVLDKIHALPPGMLTPPFANHNKENNNIFMMSSQRSKHYLNLSNFPSIESNFFLSPLPSILNNLFVGSMGDLGLQNREVSAVGSGINPMTGSIGESTSISDNLNLYGTEESNNLSNLDNHQPHGSSNNLYEKFLNSSHHNQHLNDFGQVNNQINDIDINQSSPITIVSYQILKILSNLMKEKEFIIEFCTSNSISTLIGLFTNPTIQSTTSSNDQTIIFKLLTLIFSQIMSHCCLSFETLNLLHKYKLIKILLGILDSKGSEENSDLEQAPQGQQERLPIGLMIDLCKVLIYTIKSSSRIYKSLHDDFVKHNGYSILLSCFIYISDYGTIRNKLEFIRATCDLLFIGFAVNNTTHQFSKVNIANIRVFEIYLNVFSVTSSEETKTELLKCIKGIFYLSIISDEVVNGASAITSEILLSHGFLLDEASFYTGQLDVNEHGIIKFHQLEPFKILFSQFDNLNLSNRKIILEMMDLLLLKDRISTTEIKFYCSLFESKYPSTILLVTQHLTGLLSRQKISRDVLKECGLIEVIQGYLVDPTTLRFSATLEDSSPLTTGESKELPLCFAILGEKKRASEAKFYILWMIVTKILQLMLEFFNASPQIQSEFVEKNGLKALKALLIDEYLIQPALQVIATIAISPLQMEERVISDLMEVLFNGGSTTDSKVLTQRRHILATMCYIFHNNHQAKNQFKPSGFIWSVSILDVISRTVANQGSNQSHHIHHSPRTVSYVSQPSSKKLDPKSATNNEIFFFLKVLIDTLSAVMKNNPSNQEYFRKVIQFSTLYNTLKACRYMEGIYSTALADSLLNMAVSGSWPPSCEEHSLEDGSLLSLYSPITSFFPNNATLSKNFDFHPTSHPSSPGGDDPISPDDNQSLNQHHQEHEHQHHNHNHHHHNHHIHDLISSTDSPRRRNRSYTNESLERPIIVPTSPNLMSQTTYTSLDLATELRPSSSQIILTTSYKLPEKSSLALAQERYFSCQSCRDSLTIENPEIFKLIILLTGGTEEEIAKIETKSFCYILRELIFLASASLVNQKKLSSLLIDIIDHYKPLLLANQTNFFGSPGKKKSLSIPSSMDIHKLKPLLFELIQSISGHNITLLEFRKYFELFKINHHQYPIDLLNLLLKITSNRENIPLYYAELSKNGLEYIDFPYLGERQWPPTKGFGVSLWFRYSAPFLNTNKTPIFLLSMEGVIGSNKTCEVQVLLDNGILYYRINYSNAPNEQCSFTEFRFEPDQFYHIVITQASAPPGQKISPVKLYVNGYARGSYPLSYPKSQLTTLFTRLGGTNASSINQDFNANSCWHLGNAYFFDDLPLDKEIFYLYLLGPDHFRGLKLDLSVVDQLHPTTTIEKEKNTNLHPLLIEHLSNPTVLPLQSLHEKIMTIFTAKCLYVTAHKYANKSEAVTHVSAQPQPASQSSILNNSLSNSTSFASLSEITSSSAGAISQSRKGSLLNSLSSSISSSSFATQSGITSSSSVSSGSTFLNPISIISGSIGMPTNQNRSQGPSVGPTVLNNSFQSQSQSLLGTGLPFPLPPGVISQVGVKDIIINSGGVSVLIYLIAMSPSKEYQRTSLKLLQNVIHNSPPNLKEMRDIFGYELISHIIRKNNWELDDGLLSILFSFVGIQRPSSHLSNNVLHFTNGVVADVLALKHFLLERSIWKRASISDQKILFESLEKLVSSLHGNHDFNIMKFRQAGVFETILKMCREDDLPLELLTPLSSILHSIINHPPKLNGDLQLLLSYLLESMPIGKKSSSFSPPHLSSLSSTSQNTSSSSSSSSSPFFTLRRRNRLFGNSNNNNNSNTDSTPQVFTNNLLPSLTDGDDDFNSKENSDENTHQENVRLSILNLLLDVLSKSDISVTEDFHSICSIETIFGLLVNESMVTRTLLLKIIDRFLHSPNISVQFQKMKGFHLLGYQLCSYKMSEEIFGVLFCILFGKPSTNSDMLGVPMRMYFLSQISDSEMKYPGVLITMLITLCNCSFNTQQIVIKMIHNIFLQNDQFKTILLENELIPRLVDILASNFQRRSNQIFNYNYNYQHHQKEQALSGHSKEDLWIAEESILSLLKEIALYGAKSQDGSTILRDILVVLHLNQKMDFEYTCCLQRRVLFDIISFFHDNKNFGNIDSLVSSYEKLCVLSINTLCYQERTINPASNPTPSSKKGAFKSFGNFASNFSPVSNKKKEKEKESLAEKEKDKFQNILDDEDVDTGNTVQQIPTTANLYDSISSSNNEMEQQTTTTNDESSNTDSDRNQNTSTHKYKKPSIPIWIKEGNLLNQEEFIVLLLTVLSNTKISQAQNSSYKNLFSTSYSARSLLCKFIHLLLTNPEFVDQNCAVLDHLIFIPNIGNSVISEIIQEEEFIYTLFCITFKFLNNDTTDPEVQKSTVKLWTKIIQSISQETLRKIFDPTVPVSALYAASNSQDPSRELLSKYQSLLVENEFKKWEEKNNQSKKEWKLQYLEIQKNKLNIITKNQDISKSTKKLSDSLIQLKTEYEKSNIQLQIEHRESKRLFQTQWKLLIKKVTHETAIWGDPPQNPLVVDPSINDYIGDNSLLTDSARLQKSLLDAKWKLDPTEGSHRMRLRMKRVIRQHQFNTMSIPESPLSKGSSDLVPISSPNSNTSANSASGNSSTNSPPPPLNLNNNSSSLHGSLDYSADTLKVGEKVNEIFKCSCISPFYQRDGELLIGEGNVYFLDESLTAADRMRSKLPSTSSTSTTSAEMTTNSNISSIKPPQRGKHIVWSYDDIIEIHKRRHVLKNSAIEIFLGSGVPHKTYLFAFNNTTERDTVYDLIMSKPLPNRVDYAAEVQGNILKLSITKKWQRGLISNFEYLMHLNTLAGRSFNDLTQYPIFPFILKDYESEELDLTNSNTFRDLSKPMGAQDPTRLKKFIDKYNYLKEVNETPYHYGSHYSNIGSVLHFLVRLQPFSSYFIDFQGGRFDVPDRAFHSIVQTWNLSSSISSSDVKELIPEFFYLPDFLVNSNHFNMGTKQDGIKVDNVILPKWAKGDPKLFIKKHMEALECKHVSENLHLWIDLMFGSKQQGEAAVKAFNMFFPLTYEGAVEIDGITDQLVRDATIAQIHSYGQTPKQIFKKDHPKKNWTKTLKAYEFAICNKYDKLVCFPMSPIKGAVGSIAISGDATIPLSPQRILLYPDSNKFISWGHWDQNLRVYTISDNAKVLSITEVYNDDTIACDITKNGRLFVTGGTAGTVKVWKRCNSDGTLMTRKERGDHLSLWSTLYGHTNSILCITVSQEFSTIVSGSKDCNAIIWDLNRLSYVNSLQHNNPVTCVTVSPTSNYIATFETVFNETGQLPAGSLRLWTGNGQKISEEAFSNDRVNAMIFTSAPEGMNNNVLITGMESGTIIFWNSTTLQKLKVLYSPTKSPITALAVNKDHTQLIVGDVNGQLEYWSAKTFDGYSAIVGGN